LKKRAVRQSATGAGRKSCRQRKLGHGWPSRCGHCSRNQQPRLGVLHQWHGTLLGRPCGSRAGSLPDGRRTPRKFSRTSVAVSSLQPTVSIGGNRQGIQGFFGTGWPRRSRAVYLNEVYRRHSAIAGSHVPFSEPHPDRPRPSHELRAAAGGSRGPNSPGIHETSISNAIDAIDGDGVIHIRTEQLPRIGTGSVFETPEKGNDGGATRSNIRRRTSLKKQERVGASLGMLDYRPDRGAIIAGKFGSRVRLGKERPVTIEFRDGGDFRWQADFGCRKLRGTVKL